MQLKKILAMLERWRADWSFKRELFIFLYSGAASSISSGISVGVALVGLR